MKRHLIELLTEGKFTTVQVYFETQLDKYREDMPAPPNGLQHPRSARSSVAFRKPELNEYPWGEVAPETAMFPFVDAALPAKTYTYKVNHMQAANLAKGDRVVVPTDADAFAVATVWMVDKTPQIDYNAQFEYRWLVQKVDAQEYNQNLAHEQQFRALLEENEKQRQREAIRSSMLQNMLPTDPDSLAQFNEALKVLGVPAFAAPVAPPAQ